MAPGLKYPHQPVMVQEVIANLIHNREGIYVDGTVGSGGHSEAIGRILLPTGRLICLDIDPDAVILSKKRLSFMEDSVCILQANYTSLDTVLLNLGVKEIDGILLDLGMSSYQLDRSKRGFSFMRDEPLDMRMDPNDEITAEYLINRLSSKELVKLLRDYGEEKRAKTIVKAIERERLKGPIKTSSQLAGVIESVSPPIHRTRGRHPATRTFQALRIAVNKELRNIKNFLAKAPFLLSGGGRLVVISYHSLEDRLIKQAMVDWEKACICPPDFPRCVCEKHPIMKRMFHKGLRPGKDEIKQNPRARSAMLRAAKRIWQ